MPAKVVELHEKARAGIVRGATLVAQAARVTLGPKGRNVLIQRSFGAPLVTKDGVTVVKEIELEDRFENMGAMIIREVAQKTGDVAGDGTTTATVLARTMVSEGIKLLAAVLREKYHVLATTETGYLLARGNQAERLAHLEEPAHLTAAFRSRPKGGP